jgi:Domain of unknown function (DUF4397)
MQRLLSSALVASALALALAACNGSSPNSGSMGSSTPAMTATAKVQVIHASPDAPAVNVLLDGAKAVSSLDYGLATPFLQVPATTHSIEVDALLPGGATTQVIGPGTITTAANRLYTVLAVGRVGGLDALVVSDDDTPVPNGSTRLRVVHAAPAAPKVDVYLTAPGVPLTGQTPVGSFSFKQTLGPAQVASGSYEIRVTPTGSQTVVYDSGTVTLPSGGNLTVAAIENTTTGTAPVQLVISDGQQSTWVPSVGTPAGVRVVHASPDAPAVDVVVNGNFASPLVGNLAYPSFTSFAYVPPATYNVKVAPTGTQTAVISADLSLVAGTRYTVLAVDKVAKIAPLVLSDDPRRIATAAKLRLVHASPTAGPVDIYVTAQGAGIASATPLLTNVPFKASTGFLQVKPGTYDVTVTPTGSKTVAIGPATITINGGGIYTAVARDPLPNSNALGVILMDDFSGG